MELLDYNEAAKILKIAPTTLRKKTMRREVPFLKPFGPNGRVLFEREALEEFLRASRVAPLKRG